MSFSGFDSNPDVDLNTPPSDGQTLVYNKATQRWHPVTITGGSGGGGGPVTPVFTPVAMPVTNTNTVSINHGLSYVPRVTITDMSGNEVEADEMHSPGVVQVMFGAPFNGLITVGA